MALTKFPNGVSSFGIPQVGAGTIPVTFTGTYFYVNSGNGNSGYAGTSPDAPLATLRQAVLKCTANKGDVIVLLPGHAETVTTNGQLVDVAGVQIVGLGRGAQRPTFTYSSDVTISVTAANVSWDNCIFKANFADVAAGITVSGKDFQLSNSLFSEAGTDLNWFTCIATSATNNAADGLTIINCQEFSIDAAAKAFISILANNDRVAVLGNYVTQASAADIGHFMIMGAFVMLHARIAYNVLNLTGDNNAQTVGIFMTGSSTTSTGVVHNNFCGSLDTTGELFDTATLDFHHFENYATGTIAKSGTILPAIE